MKTFILRSFIGIFFGGFIAVLITNSAIFFGDLETINADLFFKNSLGSIFCGWFFTVGPLYFENRKLTLPQQTALHFFTVMILYFILAFSIGWIPFTLGSFLLTFVISLVAYILFWIGFYLYFKHQAKTLNDELRKI